MCANWLRNSLTQQLQASARRICRNSLTQLQASARRICIKRTVAVTGLFTAGLANTYFVAGIASAQPCETSLEKIAKERGIKFFYVAFVDLFGVLRTKMVPAEAIATIQKDGAGFAPFASWLDYDASAADMMAIPDPSTLIQVPFQKDIGFVIGDLYVNGEPVEHSPRWVLKNQIDKAKELGYELKTGVEPEFILLDSGGREVSDNKDTNKKPCYEAQALTRRYDVLKEIVENLNSVGFGIYQIDHEDANGQFEINWHYDDCLLTADRHVFFKWCVKTISERHGFKATFMPRPFTNLSGNGCHIHCSLWRNGENVFIGNDTDPHNIGLSETACHFLGGILNNTRSICAITNPVVNSYKRLNGSMTDSGATWAPNYVTVGGNNRSHMVRIPDNDRFELRLPDGAVNPYLLPAAVIGTGLSGLKKTADVTPFVSLMNCNMYTLPPTAPELQNIPKLPSNMLDAIRLFEEDPEMSEIFGSGFVKSFSKLKKKQWKDFTRHMSKWELDTTLDC